MEAPTGTEFFLWDVDNQIYKFLVIKDICII